MQVCEHVLYLALGQRGGGRHVVRGEEHCAQSADHARDIRIVKSRNSKRESEYLYIEVVCTRLDAPATRACGRLVSRLGT
jgi:hypothetical protein